MKNFAFLFASIAVGFMLMACESENSPKVAEYKPKVRVLVAHQENLSSGRRYAGSIEATASTFVSFSAPGTVKSLNVHEGKKVHKGSLVGELDDTSAKSALEIAQAMKGQAEDARSRMKKLYDNKSISEIQWMEVESKYKQAVASEKIAQKALDDCKLYAPATGVVSSKSVEVGQNVLPGTPIFSIVDILKVKASVSVPEAEIGSIRLQQKVTVTVPALGNKTFSGKVSNKGISANVLNRSYEIEVELNNSKGELLPGMIADIEIQTSEGVNGIAVPTNAVELDERNGQYVWCVQGGLAKRRNVSAVLGTKNSLLVTEGLSEGDSVIVVGTQKVGENSKVIIENR